MSESQPAVQQVVQALQVLYQDPDPAAKEKANAWLQEFQKGVEAWSTAQLILFAPDAPVQTKLFAAQTFRTKITYDLDQLPAAHRLPLRDSLLTALRTFAPGPRVILTQVCISLADLALQLTSDEWADPTTAMIEMFGADPAMAGALLEFLQVLAEEYNGNLKLDVRSDFGRVGKAGGQGGTDKAAQVVALLSMYVQAPGITTSLQDQCFACLGAWLKTGQASATSIGGTPILAALFAALASDELFDAAVDALVDLIHETQEIEENMGVIQELVPRLAALRPNLLDPATRADSDQMRGYCRILVEAGEWYDRLIVPHLESFLPLVELIAICAAYDDLSVAGITLNFWYRLARAVGKVRDDPAVRPLLAVFSDLVGTIIRHLHYPDDDAALTGQERDDFRNFRHTIGDTLKDCCTVLGATACLRRSYDIISTTLSTTPAAEVKWQDLEAPLFSMRSMGAEVDPADNEVMPLIMDLMPKLPSHPKIRYAAILVIGRYTQWINLHPDHIAFQLPYVSSGFDDSDKEVWAASAQTLKYLCKDCSHHLVVYLPQLHSFVGSVAGRIGSEDLLDISAGIAHIICVMPLAEAPQALSSFCMPNIEIVHAVTVQPTPATRAELRLACDALERIDMLLAIVDRFPDGLPPACAGTCEQVWGVLEAFLAKYAAQDPRVAEKVCIALRRGLQFFDDDAFRVAPSVLETLSNAFDAAPASSYLWITGKMVGMFARRQDQAYEAVLKVSVERSTTKIYGMLQQTEPAQLADILDDYVHLIYDLIEYNPELLFLSPAFSLCFQTLLSTTLLLSPQIVLAALDALRALIGHESLDSTSPFPAAFGQAVRAVVEGASVNLVRVLVSTLVDGLEDTTTNILTILRLLAVQFPLALAREVPGAVGQVPVRAASQQDRQEFLTRFSSAMTAQNPNQVKDAFTWLLRASKKSQERARVVDDRR